MGQVTVKDLAGKISAIPAKTFEKPVKKGRSKRKEAEPKEPDPVETDKEK